jgi:hypothetical protein
MPYNIRHCLKGLILLGTLNYTNHDSGKLGHRSAPAQLSVGTGQTLLNVHAKQGQNKKHLLKTSFYISVNARKVCHVAASKKLRDVYYFSGMKK